MVFIPRLFLLLFYIYANFLLIGFSFFLYLFETRFSHITHAKIIKYLENMVSQSKQLFEPHAHCSSMNIYVLLQFREAREHQRGFRCGRVSVKRTGLCRRHSVLPVFSGRAPLRSAARGTRIAGRGRAGNPRQDCRVPMSEICTAKTRLNDQP